MGGLAHRPHAQEDKAEAEEHGAELPQRRAASEGEAGEAESDHREGVVGHLEGDDLRGDGGADVGGNQKRRFSV